MPLAPTSDLVHGWRRLQRVPGHPRSFSAHPIMPTMPCCAKMASSAINATAASSEAVVSMTRLADRGRRRWQSCACPRAVSPLASCDGTSSLVHHVMHSRVHGVRNVRSPVHAGICHARDQPCRTRRAHKCDIRTGPTSAAQLRHRCPCCGRHQCGSTCPGPFRLQTPTLPAVDARV